MGVDCGLNEGEEQSMGEDLNRRDFITKAAEISLGAGVGLAARRTVLGANDRVVVGVIGCGEMGSINMGSFMKHPGVEIGAISDVYQPRLDKGIREAGGRAKPYKDFRQLLDDKDIEAVIIATPDHWHALQTVMACQAGKDVYVEKPISTTLEEGKSMVEAARKYGRVTQVGTWQRSGTHFQKAVQLVQGGIIGQVRFARTWNYRNFMPDGFGSPPDSDPPRELDWDLWLGPAPQRPFNRNRWGIGNRWSTFRYFWDYAGGWMTDWGIHLLDVVLWAMKSDGPRVITALGGKYSVKDNRETPDTLQVTYEFPGFVCTYEMREANGNSMYGRDYGIEFHGTEGTLFLDRDGFQVYPEKWEFAVRPADRTAALKMESVNDALYDHATDFLECMRSRQRAVCDIEVGYRSSSMCFLANIAYRSKDRLIWDTASQRLTQGNEEARRLLDREYRAPWKLAV
jgi:predicted dehydrogenase